MTYEASAGVDEIHADARFRRSSGATLPLPGAVCWTVPSRVSPVADFGLFVLLATGLVAQTARRTVVGMLVGAGVAAVVSFYGCCRFFSQHRWDVDQIGWCWPG